jgi:thiamine pyrophosphate-dependent acetolactate synthase large subunit-like protein
MKSKRYLIEALKAEGVKYVFLVPGGELDPLVFDFLEEGVFS